MKKFINEATLVLALILGQLLLFTACSNDLSQGASKMNLKIEGTTSNSPFASAAVTDGATATISVIDQSGTEIGQLTLSDARIGLKEIEFKYAESDSESSSSALKSMSGGDDSEDESENEDSEDKIDFEGPYVADLLNNTVTPSLDSIALPLALYTKVELKMEALGEDDDDEHGDNLVDVSDPLFNNSVYIEGTYTGQTAGGYVTDAPFVFSYDLNEEFELTADNASMGVSMDNGVSIDVIIAFRLGHWFEFNNAETNGNDVSMEEVVLSGGEIVLDESASSTNSKIRQVIKNNIKISAEFGEDKDDDGHLEDDEDSSDHDELESEDD